ncbi:hypothetical protein [Pseudoxanthomonas jiangsuensis]|uniref:hypothetical protein n=1 Tax=Pseudoxanthomonas jiangsuensis TaxID=619688 RepID=UPI001390AA18|nr:hypothetical protein [Pseudoxanthomonas jiangsuensis]
MSAPIPTYRNGQAGPWSSWIWLPAGILAALGLVAGVETVLPQFAQSLAAFGTDLPWPTRLVLEWHRLAWLAALVPVAAWWSWPQRRHRGIAAAVAGLAAGILVIVLATAALSLPVMQLARTI